MIHDLLSQQPQGQADDKPEVVLATIPQRSDDTVLEVVMMHKADGATDVELRSLVWGNGLGWYRQHTLQLDGTTARNLIQALGVAVSTPPSKRQSNRLAYTFERSSAEGPSRGKALKRTSPLL
jgi:hypothetical protein